MLQCDIDILFAFIAFIRGLSLVVVCSPRTGPQVHPCCQVNEGVADGSRHIHAHAFTPLHGIITTAKPARRSFIYYHLHPHTLTPPPLLKTINSKVHKSSVQYKFSTHCSGATCSLSRKFLTPINLRRDGQGTQNELC